MLYTDTKAGETEYKGGGVILELGGGVNACLQKPVCCPARSSNPSRASHLKKASYSPVLTFSHRVDFILTYLFGSSRRLSISAILFL